MIESLNQLDISLFEILNFNGGKVMNELMALMSDKLIWIPLYLYLVYLLIIKYKWSVWLPLIAIALLITLTDQFTSSFMKPFFERLRPCHQLGSFLNIHLPYSCGGRYGFASSHAANTFGLAILFYYLFNKKWTYILILWSIIVGYSRIYLAAHFPGDVIMGFAIGWIFAYLVYWLLKHVKLFHQ